MKRVPTAELLDSDAGTPAEIAGSLKDLIFFNRCFGGVTTTESMVARVAQTSALSSLSFLEVASGSLVWDEGQYRIFGLDPQHDRPLTLDTMRDSVHDEDWPKLEAETAGASA